MEFARTALENIEAILDGALAHGGAEHTRKVRSRCVRLFDHLDEGVGLGTGRPEIGLSQDTRLTPRTPHQSIVVSSRYLSPADRVIYVRSDYRDPVISDWFPA